MPDGPLSGSPALLSLHRTIEKSSQFAALCQVRSLLFNWQQYMHRNVRLYICIYFVPVSTRHADSVYSNCVYSVWNVTKEYIQIRTFSWCSYEQSTVFIIVCVVYMLINNWNRSENANKWIKRAVRRQSSKDCKTVMELLSLYDIRRCPN